MGIFDAFRPRTEGLSTGVQVGGASRGSGLVDKSRPTRTPSKDARLGAAVENQLDRHMHDTDDPLSPSYHYARREKDKVKPAGKRDKKTRGSGRKR